MKENEEIVLEGVEEYAEGYDVTLYRKNDNGRLVVCALNEGGYNGVDIDAEQLYNSLKKYFEGETKTRKLQE
jgi:hypothetical protein